MTKRRLTDAEIDRIVAMCEAGHTYAAIAAAIGCSIGAVSWHCLRLGVDSPRKAPLAPAFPAVVNRGNHVVRRFTPEEDAELLRLEASGLSESEIARRLGRRFNSIRGRLMTLARRERRAEAVE